MAAELTKVYRTNDGRLFERDQRDDARKHEAWLELVTWVGDNASAIDADVKPGERVEEWAHAIATDPELLAILKRCPTEAEPK